MNIFSCISWPFIGLLWKNVYHIFCPFLIGLFLFWVLSFISSLYILDTNPLSDMSFANILSHSICTFQFCRLFPLLYRSFLFWCSPNRFFFFLFCFYFPLPQDTYLERSCYDDRSQRGYCLYSPLRFLWFPVKH